MSAVVTLRSPAPAAAPGATAPAEGFSYVSLARLVFVLGPLLAYLWALPSEPLPFEPTLLYAATSALLVVGVSRRIERTLPLWIVVVVWQIGFVLKAAVFARAIDTEILLLRFPDLAWLDAPSLKAAYTQGAYLYAVLVAAIVVAGAFDHRPPRTEHPAVGIDWLTGTAVFVVYLAATTVQALLGYGVLGVAPKQLPLQLGAVLTILRQFIVPGLLCLSYATRPRTRWLCAGYAIAAGVLDAFITTSRSSLIRFVAPVAIVALLVHRRPRARFVFAALAVVVLSAVLFPLLSSNRLERIDATADTSVSLSDAVSEAPDSLARISERVIGIDGLLLAERYRANTVGERTGLDLLFTGEGIRYYTSEVVGVTVPNDFRTPGFAGAVRLVSSPFAAAVALALLVVVVQIVWRWLARLRISVVAQALFASTVASVVSDAAVDNAIRSVLAIVALEIVVRAAAPPPAPVLRVAGANPATRPAAAARVPSGPVHL